MRRATFIMLFIILSAWIVSSVFALQGNMSADTITILNSINDLRRKENLVLIAPNEHLNQLAGYFLDDLLRRDIDALGDTFRTQDKNDPQNDKRNLEDLLAQFGYAAYSDGYVADFVSLIVRDFSPAQIVDYWNREWRNDQKLQSRQMFRQGLSSLPMFSKLYREIGLAYRFNESNGRHYYVLVFGSEPGVLPVVVAERSAVNVITETVTTPNIVLYISNENSHRSGDGNFIGAIANMRITNEPEELVCPTGISPEWDAYRNIIPWTLTDGFGLKTIYVYLCDQSRPRLSLEVKVNYASGTTVTVDSLTPTADTLGIANVTQTAAASATWFAPYLPTVEAILTATATSLPPSP